MGGYPMNSRIQLSSWRSYRFSDIISPYRRPVENGPVDLWFEVPRTLESKRDLSSSYFENILKETKLKLQMPEEEITLCFPSATEKDIWSQKIVETIVKSTSVRHQATSDWSNDTDSDDKSEQGPPDLPSERTGSYKFKLGRLKGCSYSGEWYNGKMHGKGRDPQTNRRLTNGAGYVRDWNSQWIPEQVSSIVLTENDTLESFMKMNAADLEYL